MLGSRIEAGDKKYALRAFQFHKIGLALVERLLGFLTALVAVAAGVHQLLGRGRVEGEFDGDFVGAIVDQRLAIGGVVAHGLNAIGIAFGHEF